MKKYGAILISILALFAVGISAVLANVPLSANPSIDSIPPFAGKDAQVFCPGPHFGNKEQGLVLSELYLCQARCRRNYMNTPNNPAYHRTERFLACMEDCNRFAPRCSLDSPDATPIPQY